MIGGFTNPEGSRAGIGALLLGYYDLFARRASRGNAGASRLVFSGKVGTGFTHTVALDLRRRLNAIEQKSCPFDPPPDGKQGQNSALGSASARLPGGVYGVDRRRKIRHPSFQGLRKDKKPKEVTRERPTSVSKA